MNRCAKTDLIVTECAHCQGVDLPVGVERTSIDNPAVPPGRMIELSTPEPERHYYRTPVLREVQDAYLRLADNLPAESRGKSNDNAAAYAPKASPVRPPLRVEVLDVMSRIEDDVPEFARVACDALGALRCVAFPHHSAEGVREWDRVSAALGTLDHHWAEFEAAMPEWCDEVVRYLMGLVSTARRVMRETAAPVPLARPCPKCSLPTVFRVETGEGQIAACSNPECQTRWTDIEWEDAHSHALSVHSG